MDMAAAESNEVHFCEECKYFQQSPANADRCSCWLCDIKLRWYERACQYFHKEEDKG